MGFFVRGMSMSFGFNLDLNSYSLGELENVYGLGGGSYGVTEIESKEQKMIHGTMSDYTIPSEVKHNIVAFISGAKKKLVEQALARRVEINDTSGDRMYMNTVAGPGLGGLGRNSEVQRRESQRELESYRNTFPSEWHSDGSLNPLKIRTLKQNLNVDTRFRPHYFGTSSSNFHLDLPMKFSKVLSMQLSAMEFPTTFYTISKIFGNNVFTVTIDGRTEIVTIPDGNYVYFDLVKYLNAYMEAYSTASDVELQKFQYVTFNVDVSGLNSGSGKMIVGVKQDPPFEFSLNFAVGKNGDPEAGAALPLKFGWLVGFRSAEYHGMVNYVSEGIVDLTGPRYIYLAVDDYNNSVNNGFYGAFTESIMNKNVLARIALQGSVFQQASQNNLALITTARQYFGPVDIQKLHVQVLDEYGRVLDLNHMDFSFCLTFHVEYNL